MKNVILLTICLLLLSTPAANAADSAPPKPNIIFFLFDDMGWGQPQSYNSESALRTPNLDRLAGDGMRFTDAHSASAVCTPTRYGVLTGRYPWRIGQFGVLTSYSKPIIPASRLTVASLLRQQGYHTACIGKWHLGMNWGDASGKDRRNLPVGTRITDGPNAVGFDYFCGYTHARNIGTVIEQDKVVANIAEDENQPLMLKKALAYLEQRAGSCQPFFLYFPVCPPHTPIAPAGEFIGKSGGTDLVKKDPKYADWVFQGDAMLGGVIDALNRLKLADNTLLIVTADNGASGREYAPLRACKTSIYEGGHRVPFVVRWPGKVKPGSTWNHTVCLNDLLATAAAVTGATVPAEAGEDSVSFLPALLGTSDAPTREATVHQSLQGDLAIRQGAWKLIFQKDGGRELYNLADDLGEQSPRSDSQEVAAKLTALMEQYIAKGRSTPGAAQQNEFVVSLDLKNGPGKDQKINPRKSRKKSAGDE